MANFALIGAGGFIAPRHMQAINDTGHRLGVALDRNDSVGILDRFAPDVAFFTEFERFDRHVEKLRRGPPESCIDWVSICSPNYLHDAHVRFALRIGANAICEKPLVLEPWNVNALQELERESGRRIWCILQLRLHPHIIALRQRVAAAPKNHTFDVDLTYITTRGPWYLVSWKGLDEKSGGVTMNIGVHFFDMLQWIFGHTCRNDVHFLDRTRAAGYLEMPRARVRWLLSVNPQDLPREAAKKGQRTFRAITVDGQEIEFSEGFTDLHTQMYRAILDGHGFGTDDVRPSIQLVHDIRNATPVTSRNDTRHPLAIF